MPLITDPYTFSNGTVADALEVNARFNPVYNVLNGNLDSDNMDMTAPYIFTGTVTVTNFEINDTSADHQYVLGVSELTQDRGVTLPLLTADDTFVFQNHTQTLSNKSFDTNTSLNLTNNLIFDGDEDSDTFITAPDANGLEVHVNNVKMIDIDATGTVPIGLNRSAGVQSSYSFYFDADAGSPQMRMNYVSSTEIQLALISNQRFRFTRSGTTNTEFFVVNDNANSVCDIVLSNDAVNWTFRNDGGDSDFLKLRRDTTEVWEVAADGGLILPSAPSAPVANAGYRDAFPKAIAGVNSGASPTTYFDFNINSVSQSSTGIYVINWETDFVNTNYVVIPSINDSGATDKGIVVTSKATGSCTVRIFDTSSETLEDWDFTVAAWGVQ